LTESAISRTASCVMKVTFNTISLMIT